MYNTSDKLRTISNTYYNKIRKNQQIKEANDIIKINKKADKIYNKCISICEKRAKKGCYDIIIKVEVVWWIYIIYNYIFCYLYNKYLLETPLDHVFYFQSYLHFL